QAHQRGEVAHRLAVDARVLAVLVAPRRAEQVDHDGPAALCGSLDPHITVVKRYAGPVCLVAVSAVSLEGLAESEGEIPRVGHYSASSTRISSRSVALTPRAVAAL